jgi:cytoskeleton protein RodZ
MAKVTRVSLEDEGGIDLPQDTASVAEMPRVPVGEALRAARERRREGLDEVSRALKIRKAYLEAIEKGDSAALPGRAYALGFVRSYGDYIGLDPVRLVERYKAETAEPGAPTEAQLTYPEQQRFPSGAIFLALLLVVAVGYGGYYLFVSANRAEQRVEQVPARLTAEVAPQNQPLVRAPGAVPGGVAADPATAAQAAALPAGKLYGEKNLGSRIMLRVHLPAKILVQGADNTVYINRTLTPGDLYQVPNTVGLTVSTADSGTVEVILDGASLGFLGTRGAIAEGLSLDPQDLVDRANQNHAG